MAIFNIFSKRQRRSKPDALESLEDDDISDELRIQLLHALNDARTRIYQRTSPAYEALGTEGMDVFAKACLVLRRELGMGRLAEVRQRVRSLYDTQTEDLCNEFTTFFENCQTEQVLDAIEVVMHFIRQAEQERLLDQECNARTVAHEINQRFLEHAVGFQFQSGQIIAQTNLHLHSEVIAPSLVLLSAPAFQGANEEFLKAHEHYRHHRYQECLVECLKAFESTMKIICDLKKWPYKQNDTAKTLIECCLSNGLLPSFTQQQITSVRTLLESGVPTLRNKAAGHGQGVERNDVPAHLARFALHLSAAIIVLLVEAYQERT